MEGVGVFLVALLGANVMYGAELDGAGPLAVFAPALGFAIATTIYRATIRGAGERAALGSMTSLDQRRPAPVEPEGRRTA